MCQGNSEMITSGATMQHKQGSEEEDEVGSMRRKTTVCYSNVTYFLLIVGVVIQLSVYNYALMKNSEIQHGDVMAKAFSTNRSYPNLAHFSARLFSEVCKEEKANNNVFLSPFSIAIALSVAAAGSTPDSVCQQEIYQALGLVHSHNEMAALLRLIAPTNGMKMAMANSLWTKSRKQEYASLMLGTYDASVRKLPTLYRPIENWTSSKTEGLISNLIHGHVDPRLKALLVSAIHFRGLWDQEFDSKLTKYRSFHHFSISDTRGRFMKTERKLHVATEVPGYGGATIVRLDYSNQQLSNAPDVTNYSTTPQFCALFVLPGEKTEESMEQALQGFTTSTITDPSNPDVPYDLTPLVQRDVILTLPRFRMEWSTDSLKTSLQNMGVNSAFSMKNMFTAMTDDPEVNLSDVIHKVVMEVNENGASATPSTQAQLSLKDTITGLSPPQALTFDRPFLMVVMHIPTGTPLFLAKILKPDFI